MPFPTSIEQKFLRSGFNEAPLDNIISSANDHGLSKTRRRFTGKMRTFSGSIVLDDQSQYDDFMAWYYSEAAEGSAYFTFANPHGGAALTLRIVELSINVYAETGWLVNWTLMEQPYA